MSFFVLTGVAFGQEQTDSIKEAIFNAHWLKNELQTYRLKHESYVVEAGDTAKLEALRIKAEVYVQDSMSGAYTLKWRFGDFQIETDHYLSLQWFANIPSFELVYTTSRFGVLNEFTNIVEMKQHIQNYTDRFFADYPGRTTEESRAHLYRLSETFETFLLEIIHQYHQAYGMAYTMGEIVEVPTEVETPYSDTPIKASIRKKLSYIEAATAGLVTATLLDSTQMHQALQTYLLKQNREMPVFRQENTGALVMHLPTGWVLYSFDTKEVLENKSIYGENNEITVEL